MKNKSETVKFRWRLEALVAHASYCTLALLLNVGTAVVFRDVGSGATC